MISPVLKESLKEIIEVSSDEFVDVEQHNYIQAPNRIITQNSLPMNALLVEFMDKLMLSYTD